MTSRTRRQVLPALALAASLSSAACNDWGEDGVARLNQLFPQPIEQTTTNGSACQMPDVDGGMATDPSGSCVGLLSGQWAARLIQFGNISPIGPPAWRITTTDLFLVHVASGSTALQLTFCGEANALTDSTGKPETVGQTSVPDILVNALALVPVTVPLPGDGTLQSSNVVWLWGLQGLTNPVTDPLPTTADAGTVWDQDMDGFPGVTMDVALPQGGIYLVKRSIFNFMQGKVMAGWATGPMQFTLEQITIGASTPILGTTEPISPRTDCTSLYQLKCVDPTFTCADLVQGYQTQFVNAPQ